MGLAGVININPNVVNIYNNKDIKLFDKYIFDIALKSS